MTVTTSAKDALAIFLNTLTSNIGQSDRCTFEFKSARYKVYTEDEANTAHEKALCSHLDWENTTVPAMELQRRERFYEMGIDYTPDDEDEEPEEEACGDFDENNRAHFLSPYDRREHQTDGYYIYRIG